MRTELTRGVHATELWAEEQEQVFEGAAAGAAAAIAAGAEGQDQGGRTSTFLFFLILALLPRGGRRARPGDAELTSPVALAAREGEGASGRARQEGDGAAEKGRDGGALRTDRHRPDQGPLWRRCVFADPSGCAGQS